MRDLLTVIGLACLAVVLLTGYATFRVWAEGQRDDSRPADAIVVMGAAQYDGRPSPVFAARIDRALRSLMDQNDLKTAVFVSDRPHMLRVLRMAADEGITAYGSPTTTSPIEGDPLKRADATVHELLALAQYFLVGGASGAP